MEIWRHTIPRNTQQDLPTACFVQIPPNKACLQAHGFPTCWKAWNKAAHEHHQHLQLVMLGRWCSPHFYIPEAGDG